MALHLGYFTIVMSVLCLLLMMMPNYTSAPAVDRFDYGPKGNPFIGFGTADHQAPRELAVSVGGTSAMKAITGQGLANLPRLSTRSEREKTAVETINHLDFKELAGTLLVTPDLGSEARPSTPAVLAHLLVDDASCLADSEAQQVFDRATDGHPSKSANSERGCGEKFESCYESCHGGFWNWPAPGACHLVCTVMKETCGRCTEKGSNADERRIVQRQHSLASCSPTSSFLPRPTTNTIMRNSRILWTIWLLETVGVAVWIVQLKAKLSASDKRIEAMTKAQAEQVATAADNNNLEHDGVEPEVDEQPEVDEEPEVNDEPEDNGRNTEENDVHSDEGVGGDQPVAEEANRSKGPLAKGFNFIVGWTKDRILEMRTPHQA